MSGTGRNRGKPVVRGIGKIGLNGGGGSGGLGGGARAGTNAPMPPSVSEVAAPPRDETTSKTSLASALDLVVAACTIFTEILWVFASEAWRFISQAAPWWCMCMWVVILERRAVSYLKSVGSYSLPMHWAATAATCVVLIFFFLHDLLRKRLDRLEKPLLERMDYKFERLQDRMDWKFELVDWKFEDVRIDIRYK